MDPVSVIGILSGVSTLIRLLDSSLLGLTDLISHSRKVDQTIQGFHDDIEALSVTIASVSARLRRDGENRFALDSQASQGAAQSLSISISACQRLVQSLEDCIPTRRSPGEKENYVRRLWLQIRLNRSKDIIRGVQGQIQTHTGIINTAFNLLIL